ncbi:hypothetical protein KZC52_16070 [Microbacterium sp. kSW2-24]|uniref:hypothetical protein n=1 Tax=Microbacterium galbinum TaxID=2851646 RepID=UPI001FFDBA26|nr:hypothetical protein [Microbacterium galbinum]MCK2024447.1 hypothetical protein [Microbacterium galbinum]
MAAPPAERPDDPHALDENSTESTPLLAKMTFGLLTSVAGGVALIAIFLVTLFGFFGIPYLLLYGLTAWWD